MLAETRRKAVAERARPVVESSGFSAAALLSILGNATLLALETYPHLFRAHGALLADLQHVFLGLFALEIAARALAEADRPRSFFTDPWNIFDLFLLVATLVPFGNSGAGVLRLLRLARVLRAARMLPHVRLIATAIGRSLPGMVGFLMVGAIVLFLYSMVGWMLFGRSDPEHYGTVGLAGLTLFLLITLDGIGDMVRSGLDVTTWTIPYYVSFVLFASFLLVNTLIGVVITSLDEAREAAGGESAAPAAEPAPAPVVPAQGLRSHVGELRSVLLALEHAVREEADGREVASREVRGPR
ncbi:ion transporter [Streptomyces sp. SID8379]|uniref:ion transporter n=1 Tax=unclassified Streptomyces TaxID=2593676 RepID=UPI0003696390|nr:ion transporter [Streptomyces sp. HmicA12]MYW63227.1 ion transporter [Streptomyces sp. SID8379]